ncbi:MAG: hypothetical protein PHT07_21370 [Paludibacter sp.]|nr:hypothetical protein [Paludibacter sp.]
MKKKEIRHSDRNIKSGNKIPLIFDEDGLPQKTYTADEIENMVWDKMSDHYGIDFRTL